MLGVVICIELVLVGRAFVGRALVGAVLVGRALFGPVLVGLLVAVWLGWWRRVVARRARPCRAAPCRVVMASDGGGGHSCALTAATSLPCCSTSLPVAPATLLLSLELFLVARRAVFGHASRRPTGARMRIPRATS